MKEDKTMQIRITLHVVSIILILVQYLFIPLDRVLEIREFSGPLGWTSLFPLMVGVSILVISSFMVEDNGGEE